jgi:UPF0755 protein
VTSMLDPEVEQSPAKEIVHKGKGCLAVLLAASILVFGGLFVWDRASTFLSGFGQIPDYEGPGKAAVTVTVPDGASLGEIGTILVDTKVIKSTQAWDQAARSEERATSVQPGRYKMLTEMKAIDALRLLINPGESRVRVQFRMRDGQRLSTQINELVKGTKISKKSFQAALKKPETLGLPAWAENRPEGFLYPDTYELTAEATATSTLRQLTSRFNGVAGEIGLVAGAKRLKLTPYEVVTVASIIEREAGRAEDRAKIARVLYNRLAEGKKLELDSTVAYARNLNTVTTTPKDRDSDSPYNTYKFEGLPPGPIAAPGRATLEAALEPADGKWLYFVAVNLDTGETKFAETFKQHSANVREFQAWCQANKGRCT